MPLPAAGADRTCLVTGASSGIGADIARELARRGHGVTLVARREQRLKALADDLASAHGVRTEVLSADLADEDAREEVAATMSQRGLEVHVLVNNAGVSTTGPVRAADRSKELAMVRIDVEAVVDLCTIFLPAMVAAGRGAILNVASTAAFQPLPGQAGYAASKAFVLAYTQALRAELHGTGVTASALCPGPVDTEFVQTSGMSEQDALSALPRFMWVPSADVARAAVDGLAQGRPVIIPGVANRVGAAAAHLTPRRLLLPILARQHPALRS